MKFVVTIDIDNEAFKMCGSEISRILREISKKVHNESSHFAIPSGSIQDINGNTVGKYELKA